MPVRSTMSDLIAKVRLMINDPAGSNQRFQDGDIQATLDQSRTDVRYEPLIIAPSLVNSTNTSNSADTIFADFYSKYGWWESDLVLQAYKDGKAWVVVTPVAMELLIDQAHIQFETDVFNTGTVPGQLPPVFATGKVFDIYCAAADLLEFWAATLVGAYDFSSDGQSFKRSQLPQAKLNLAQIYRKQAKPKTAKMVREDLNAPISSRRIRLLDDGDSVKWF